MSRPEFCRHIQSLPCNSDAQWAITTFSNNRSTKRNPRLKGSIKTNRRRTRYIKKGRRIFCQRVRVKYAFIKAHQSQHAIRLLCQAAHVHRSGYYAWLQQPQSLRTKEDKRLLGLIKRLWMASGGVYGYRKVHHDLLELGESRSKFVLND